MIACTPLSLLFCLYASSSSGSFWLHFIIGENRRSGSTIGNKFLTGLSMLANFTSVVGVYRNLHHSVVGQSRLHAFQRHVDIGTRKNSGDANIQAAWHGTSRDAVYGIIKHGFGQPMIPKHGAALGRGVYLAPEKCAYVSATYSDIDENGEQHMVLCRVILGNTELVRSGSKQCHPSNEEFDTCIDDLTNPRRYIVWSTHMNTHILPEYVAHLQKMVAGLEGKIGLLEDKQDFANAGVWYLCQFVKGSKDGRMLEALQDFPAKAQLGRSSPMFSENFFLSIILPCVVSSSIYYM